MTGTMWRVTAALATMTLAVLLLVAGVGWRVYEVEAKKPKPATQIVAMFESELTYLPDPTRNGAKGAGLTGQVFVPGVDGKFTVAPGDLYVMCEPINSGEEEGKELITEVWHFDPATLTRLRTTDERLGECYALFLPWPAQWEKVPRVQVKVSVQFKPKDKERAMVIAATQTIIVRRPANTDKEK